MKRTAEEWKQLYRENPEGMRLGMEYLMENVRLDARGGYDMADAIASLIHLSELRICETNPATRIQIDQWSRA